MFKWQFDSADQSFPETLSSPDFHDFKSSWFLNYLPSSSFQAPSKAVLIPPTLKIFFPEVWLLAIGHPFFSLYLLSLSDFIHA